MKTGTHTQVPVPMTAGTDPMILDPNRNRCDQDTKKRKPRGLPFLYSYLWGTDQ